MTRLVFGYVTLVLGVLYIALSVLWAEAAETVMILYVAIVVTLLLIAHLDPNDH